MQVTSELWSWSGALVIAIAVLVCALSTYAHYPSVPVPLGNWGLKYSDIVYGVFYVRFSGDPGALSAYWYNPEALRSLLNGVPLCPVPYVDYRFEYPPVVAALWYLSTCLSIRLVYLDSTFESREARGSYGTMDRVAELHFTVHAVALSASLVATVIAMTLLSPVFGSRNLAAVVLWLLLPSTLLYSTYNWDLLCAAAALWSLVLLYRGRYLSSGALLGLSVAAKLMTVSVAYVLLLYLLVEFLRGRLSRGCLTRFAGGLVLLGALPYLTLLILVPRGFSDFIYHHSTWYCENCLYMLFVHDISSPLHRVLAAGSIATLLALVTWLLLSRRGSAGLAWIYRLAAYTLLGAVTFNYVFSPQMVLLFSPLLLLILPDMVSRIAYVVSDVANFLVMFFFFLDAELRFALSSLGLPIDVTFRPWTIDSPVQWLATLRNLLLVAILLAGLLRLREGPSVAVLVQTRTEPVAAGVFREGLACRQARIRKEIPPRAERMSSKPPSTSAPAPLRASGSR